MRFPKKESLRAILLVFAAAYGLDRSLRDEEVALLLPPDVSRGRALKLTTVSTYMSLLAVDGLIEAEKPRFYRLSSKSIAMLRRYAAKKQRIGNKRFADGELRGCVS